MASSWIVQSRTAWCLAKDQTKEPDPSANVETVCDHFIVMPWGVRRGHPTCEDCKASPKRNPQ